MQSLAPSLTTRPLFSPQLLPLGGLQVEDLWFVEWFVEQPHQSIRISRAHVGDSYSNIGMDIIASTA